LTEQAGIGLPDNPYNDIQIGLNGSWELDLWGRIRRSNEAVKADLLASEEGRRGVLLTVVATVASSYTDLNLLDKQLEIARNTAKSREEGHRLFKLQYDRGLISAVELNQALSQWEAARATIPALEKRFLKMKMH